MLISTEQINRHIYHAKKINKKYYWKTLEVSKMAKVNQSFEIVRIMSTKTKGVLLPILIFQNKSLGVIYFFQN